MCPARSPAGLIGDGHGWALVAQDGRIPRLAVSADSPLLFDEHNAFLVTVDELRSSRQYYVPHTAVLVTEMRSRTGVVEVTDAFTVRSPADLVDDVPAVRGELLRYVRVLEGRATLRTSMEPNGPVHVERFRGGLRWWHPALGKDVHLFAARPLDGPHTTLTVEAGEDTWLLLRWNDSAHRVHHIHPRRLLNETIAAWRGWTGTITYRGPHQHMVGRSALTLKLLGRSDSTTAARSAAALRDIGLFADAEQVLGRVLDLLEEGTPVGGHGHVLDCADQWAHTGGPVDGALWDRLAALADDAARLPLPPKTYTAAMCQVALERAGRLSDHLGFTRHRNWRTTAAALRDRILRDSWDESRQSLTAGLTTDAQLDPRLLALPSYSVVQASHPRMTATTNTVARQLSAAPGLLYEPSREDQGAILTYGFLLAQNLAGQNRLDEANNLYEDLSAKANALGLLSDRVSFTDGDFLGRYPSPATHTAALACAVALDRATN